MIFPVADRLANKPELIEDAAMLLGKSEHRRNVFIEVYRGRKQVKSVDDIVKQLGIPRVRITDAGRSLSANGIVEQVEAGRGVGYQKIEFYTQHRDQILRLSGNPIARGKIPTKRRPIPSQSRKVQRIVVSVQRKHCTAKLITIDDIDSFQRVEDVEAGLEYVQLSERKFKRGVARILRQRGEFNDWGGESSDLISTQVKYHGIRIATAFAFKGPGTRGILTQKKMGKNGDQIMRLARCPARLFVVQYWGQVHESVLEELKILVMAKAALTNQELYCSVIDGSDSARLIEAYPEAFET